MIKNKLIWIFLVLILLPNIIFWGSPILEKFYRNSSVTDYNGFFFTVIFIPILGSILMLIDSIKYKNYWGTIVSIIFLIITILMYMMVRAFANFGF